MACAALFWLGLWAPIALLCYGATVFAVVGLGGNVFTPCVAEKAEIACDKVQCVQIKDDKLYQKECELQAGAQECREKKWRDVL